MWLYCPQGMSLVPAVTELLLAELLYLQYDNPTRPIFMYINSAGVQVSSAKPKRLALKHNWSSHNTMIVWPHKSHVVK